MAYHSYDKKNPWTKITICNWYKFQKKYFLNEVGHGCKSIITWIRTWKVLKILLKCIFIFSDWIKCAIANKENQNKQYTKVLFKVCTKWCKRFWITDTIKRSLPFFKDFSLNWHRIFTLLNFRLVYASISHFIALHFTVLSRFLFNHKLHFVPTF